MQNDNIKVAARGFQRKLDSFKAKIRRQQLLAQSLAAEFESLTSEFESLQQLFDVSLSQIESISSDFDATLSNIESTSENLGASSFKSGSTSSNFESTLEKIDASSSKTEFISFDFESTSPNFGATSDNFESLSDNNGATSIKTGASSPNGGASSSIRELASLIRRSAKEFLKIHYTQPNIPNRMAEIVLALREKKKLSVAELRRITGASRNTLVRDIKVLKLLGWLEFHGSRKNGYFTLTASCPGFPFRKESG